MSEGFFSTGFEKLMDGTINWDSDPDVRALLLKGAGYTYNPDDDVVSDLTPASNEVTVAGYARQACSGLVVTRDDANNRNFLDCDDIVFGALAAGETISHLVLYLHDVGGDGSSQLLMIKPLAQATGVTLTAQVHASGLVAIPSVGTA